jgi:hypothetical protein
MTMMRAQRTSGSERDRSWVLIGVIALVQGCAFFPPLPRPDLDDHVSHVDTPQETSGAWKVEQIDSRKIRESSGLVKSRTHPDVFWTHNDSGDEPRIFAITARGEVLAEYEILGVEAVDWEDIAIDDSRNLYIADFGNNFNRRTDLTVYRVPEPDPRLGAGTARSDRKYEFRYSEQTRVPSHCPANFDAEALFWMEGDLYVLTKHRSDLETVLLRIPGSAEETELVLHPLARFDVGKGRRMIFGRRTRGVWHDFFGMVTAADLSPDGRTLAILTYYAIFLYERTPEGDEAGRPFELLHHIDLDSRRLGQVESIAWADDALIFGNENGALYRIPPGALTTLVSYPP